MTQTAPHHRSAASISYHQYTVGLLASLLIVRLLAIMVSPLDLGPDEAQYWRWGQGFDWGYYSKPPLIAWLIGAVTTVFGDTAAAVRLPAPVLHTLTAYLLFLTARQMDDARTGFYAVLIYILMPGVTFSSGLMTTDSVLFVFWALALLALQKLRSGTASPWTAFGFGLAIGAGFLAKYAMVYFLIGLALALLIDQPTRKAFTPHRAMLAIAGAMLVAGPHIGWNLANDLQTLSHTADNANWGGDLFHPENAVKFLVDQMGVFGPVSFLVLLTGTALALTSAASARDQAARWLLCFVLPALVIILVQAITARAHANWAATAYLAGSLLVARWMTSQNILPRTVWIATAGVIFLAALHIPDLALPVRASLGGVLGGVLLGLGHWNGWRVRGLLWTSLLLHGAAALTFTVLAAGPIGIAEKAGLANAFKRTRGWEQTARALADLTANHGATGILVDERENWHGLDFYGSGLIDIPIYAWRRYPIPKSYADMHPLPDGASGPVLIASVRRRFRARIRADFERVEEIGYLSIPLGGDVERKFKLFMAYGYHPLDRTPDWEIRFAGQIED